MLYYVSDIFLFIEKFRVLDKTVSCNHLQGQSRKWNASVSRGKEETDLPISKQDIIPGSPIPYTLIRSRRKTISIRILPSGEVEVRAPMRASRRAVEEFIYEKSDWIHLHVQRNQELYRQKKKSLETFPRQIPFLGAQLPVLEGEVSFSRGVFYLPRKPLGELLSLLQEVYKEQVRLLSWPHRILGRENRAISGRHFGGFRQRKLGLLHGEKYHSFFLLAYGRPTRGHRRRHRA